MGGARGGCYHLPRSGSTFFCQFHKIEVYPLTKCKYKDNEFGRSGSLSLSFAPP